MRAHTRRQRVGIVLAPIGVGLSIAAIWLDTVAGPGDGYWDDRSTAFYLLGVSSASGLLVARAATRGWAAAGSLLLVGFHSFVPLVYAPDRLGELRAGAWLGLAGGALLTAGAVAGGVDWPRAGRRRLAPVGLSLAAGGMAATLVAVWTQVIRLEPASTVSVVSVGTTYWDFLVTGHELGLFMLVVTAAAIALLVLGWMLRLQPARVAALAPALLLLGLTAVVPVSSDIQHLEELGPGAWLGLGGAILLVAGAYAVSRSAVSGSAPVRRQDSQSAA